MINFCTKNTHFRSFHQNQLGYCKNIKSGKTHLHIFRVVECVVVCAPHSPPPERILPVCERRRVCVSVCGPFRWKGRRRVVDCANY